MKTIKIVNAYNMLNEAKLTKMEDADKFKVIKTLRAMKKVADDYNAFLQTAKEKLQGENHEVLIEQARNWDATHKGKSVADLTPEEMKEYSELNKYISDYSERVDNCVKEEAEKDVEITIETIKEKAFGALVGSNDWKCGQILELSDILCN